MSKPLSVKFLVFLILAGIYSLIFITACMPGDQLTLALERLPVLPISPVSIKGPPLTITQVPLTSPLPCQNKFVPHTLDHITTTSTEDPHLFESNGAGVGINDLDNDGDLDIVLANLAGPNAIFWQEEGSAGDIFTFRKETLSHGKSRGVSIVDIDGDGWQDVVFTRHLQVRPTVWRNLGSTGIVRFEETALLPASKPYAMAWADLDDDGDLDMVGATYDAELAKPGDHVNPFAGGGVIHYENQGGRFEMTHLAFESHALAILLTDLNADHRLDILVGHDFLQPDQIWFQYDEGWQVGQPFAATTQNTMSFDAGDINNDGRAEILATDMMPYADDDETRAAWEPLMKDMHHDPIPGDVQVMENVLLTPNQAGKFINQAPVSGLSATGWSWSSKFGDLDNDGFLDAYIVNGMLAVEMFPHLPNYELVEENQALWNNGSGQFVAMPEWGLNDTRSGRGMSIADLDQDGDLDIVVNNLQSPAQIFENRLCGGVGLAVDLWWPESRNSRAIGAMLTLNTSTGRYQRHVRSNSGYLSGDPARVHFGFPQRSQLESLEIRWPDGEISVVKHLVGQTRVTVVR